MVLFYHSRMTLCLSSLSGTHSRQCLAACLYKVSFTILILLKLTVLLFKHGSLLCLYMHWSAKKCLMTPLKSHKPHTHAMTYSRNVKSITNALLIMYRKFNENARRPNSFKVTLMMQGSFTYLFKPWIYQWLYL